MERYLQAASATNENYDYDTEKKNPSVLKQMKCFIRLLVTDILKY